jgi:hypothetical protein
MMNKRIQKLFNEAGFHQPEMERLGIEDKYEKFAQLIIAECLNQCYFRGMSDELYVGQLRAALYIEEYFEVEP